MDLELDGRVAVVTGASKGIGLAVTRALVRDGMHVVAGAREPSPEITSLVDDGSVDFLTVELDTPDGPAALVEAAGGRIDVLVNNVGATRTRAGGFLSVTDDDWTQTLVLNLLAAVRTTRAALPVMLAGGGGSIVNIASVNAYLPDPLVIDYCAAKAALLNFSKALSKEIGPRGVRVNTVSPGPVETDLWLGHDGVAATVSATTGIAPDDVARSAVQGTATGRFSRPSEVADLVAVLASARLSNVTGSDFRIDGGLVTTT